MKRALTLASLFCVATLFGTAGAGAFTIENYGSGSDSGSKFVDPDEQAPVQHLTDPSTGQNQNYLSLGPHFGISVTPNQFSTPFGSGSRTYLDPSQPPVHPFPGYGSGAFGNNPQ
ncbi:MAG TPA: hypothetical protein VEJ16_18410 [Alphaproteobacteria bacterium]|nr:hypothetical protein [Alphaproteobacteria bacterium]